MFAKQGSFALCSIFSILGQKGKHQRDCGFGGGERGKRTPFHLARNPAEEGIAVTFFSGSVYQLVYQFQASYPVVSGASAG